MYTTVSYRCGLCALVVAAMLLAAAPQTHAQEDAWQPRPIDMRGAVPPPPPPPAWPGVARPTSYAQPQPLPQPQPRGIPHPQAQPQPLPQPRPLVRNAPIAPAAIGRCPPTPDCGLRRDDCCWPLDWCGQRYGRVTLRVEGTLTGITSPRGPLGSIETGLPNQMDWSVPDYAKDPLESVRGRIALAYAVSPTTRIEARGGWYGSWESSADASGVFAFFPGPAGMGGVSAPNTATFEAEADLYTAEITVWNEIACTGPWRFEWGIGAGAIRLDETARARDWGATFPGFAAPAFVESEVENTFIAGQFGLQTHYAVSDRLELSLLLVGRVGAMQTDATVRDRSFFAPGAHETSDDSTELAFGGLIEFGMRWRLAPRLALTGGYSLGMTDGVVRAHRAMDFGQSTSGAVGTALRKDLLVSHTVFVGLEFNF